MSTGAGTIARVDPAATAAEAITASAACWPMVALLAVALFVNEAVFRVQDAEQFAFDWQVALRLAVCTACGLYGLFHWRSIKDELLYFPGAWAVLCVLWAVVTVPWAVNFRYALASSAALGAMLLFAAVVGRRLSQRDLLRTVLGTLLAFILVCWAVYFLVPSLGRTEFILPNLEVQYRLGGLAHANALGRVTALTTVLLLAAGLQRLLRWTIVVPLLGLTLITLIMTDSRTAMIAAAVAVAVLALQRLGTSRVVAGGLALILLAGLLGLGLSFGLLSIDLETLLSAVSRSGDAEAVVTATGRTGIWDVVVERIWQSPLVGYGYGCSRFVLAGSAKLAVYHAHNQWLNAALETGLIGGLLVVAMFLGQLRRLCFSPQPFPDAVAALVIVGGLADRMVLTPIPDACTLVWLIALLCHPAQADSPAEVDLRDDAPKPVDAEA